MTATTYDYDVVIVGSGFGGSVSALRLVEKGYRVAVLEAGRRFDEESLPKTSWDLRRFLWAPALGCFGIQRIHLLRNVVVLAGAGVGGGSLNYANTLYEPRPPFYRDPQWADITDWEAELAPYFDQAKRMLGVVTNPTMTPADVEMRRVAEEMGVGHTFTLAPVGVFFGPEGTPAGTRFEDPLFGGRGPVRHTCRQCGACMTGCRFGAKNTLLTNYLYLAERAGAQVQPLTTVDAIEPQPDGGWTVLTRPTGRPGRRAGQAITAQQVILAAGTMGTQRLLHRMVAQGRLTGVSPRLGDLTRTNSEALVGASARWRPGGPDFSRGVAITSSFYPTPDTHIEPVRYGHGSNAMGLLGTLLVDGGGPWPRPLRFVLQALRSPVTFVRTLSVRHWSERTVIGLVMQSRDNSLRVRGRRNRLGRFALTSEQGHGEANPTWIPAGHEAMRRLARNIGGDAGGTLGDVFDVPMTAHFLGGAPIATSPDEGVIDPYHRVFGEPGLHVVDGSAVPANPGANPSLTITALAERAMAYWPNRAEPDLRPPLGAPYRRCDPSPPVNPVVPPGASGELRLPLPQVRLPRRDS
jgi:cholesterol oxidase